MSEIIKLYDLRLRDYPRQRGDSFRTLQISKCHICGAVTNLAVMGGYPGYGLRTICPNSAECWHHELEDKINLLQSAPHPKSYKAELQAEIKTWQVRHAEKVRNDIEGEPDFEQVEGITNVRTFKTRSRCKHF